MIITNDLVETFLKCPTKCFLRSGGEAGTGNAYAAWVRTKNDVFRIEGTKRLVAEVAPDKCAIGPQAMENPKPAQWHLGMDFAVQLQCSCHAVEQIPSAGPGRTAQFVPIRFVFRNKLNRDAKDREPREATLGPLLDRLKPGEAATVFRRLLKAHPDLSSEA
jgi:hypothetical protein